jgi:hypothetical protein
VQPIFAVGNVVSITYSEYVLSALIIQYEKLMRHIVVPYFCTLFHKRHDFGGKSFEHKRFVLIFSEVYLKNFSFQEKLSET